MSRTESERPLNRSRAEEPCDAKASSTVLKTSRNGDVPAEFDSGRVCTGTHRSPADPAQVPEAFFESHFNVTADTRRGKSRRHPDDIGKLWVELDGRTAYPLDDLVEQLTVADALRLGE
jgi:hypothetical protein